MNKEEYIAKYGEEAYEERKRKNREYLHKNNLTNKEEFIARYGEEAYEERKRYSREYHRKNDITKKEGLIARFGQEWYENWLKYSNEVNTKRYHALKSSKEQYEKHLERARANAEEYLKDPVHKLSGLLQKRKQKMQEVSPDEAMKLLMKKAEECGCPELLNMDYMVERFHDNCKYGLVYGNLEILKYFYRLMQIKIAKKESFTQSDKEMIRYFRNWEINIDGCRGLARGSDWVIPVANVDMAYVEDMMRNVQGLDLLLTEEKYNKLKGLTNDT